MANDAIPVHADKFLFAEDFVAYVFRHNTRMRLASVFRKYREFVYIGFNDTIKSAAEFFEIFTERDVDEDFIEIKGANGMNIEGYMVYARELRKVCFPEGFEAERFLYYCVYMGILAERFFGEGVLEVPTLAVMAIVEAFWNCDMFNGGWNILNRVAKKFAAVAADVEDLCTPPPTPPELSDEENYYPNPESESENEEMNSNPEDEELPKDFLKSNFEDSRMDVDFRETSGFKSQESEESSNSEREISIDNSEFLNF